MEGMLQTNDAAPIAQAPGSLGGNPSVADVAQPTAPAARAALGAAPLAAPPSQNPADAALAARMQRDQKLAGNKWYRVGAALSGRNEADERLARDVQLMTQRDQLTRQNELLTNQIALSKVQMTRHAMDLMEHIHTLDEQHREPFVQPLFQTLQYAASGDAKGAPGSGRGVNPASALLDEGTVRAMVMGAGGVKRLLGVSPYLTEEDIPILRAYQGKERIAAAEKLGETRQKQATASALQKLGALPRGAQPAAFADAAKAAGLSPLEQRALTTSDVKPEQWVLANVLPPQAAVKRAEAQAGAEGERAGMLPGERKGRDLAGAQTQANIDQSQASAAHTRAQTAGTVPQVVPTQPGGGAITVRPGVPGSATEVVTPAGQAPQPKPAPVPASGTTGPNPGTPQKPLQGPRKALDPKVQQDHVHAEEYIRNARRLADEAKKMGMFDRAAMGARLWAENKTKLPVANEKQRQFASQVEKLRADYEKAAGGLRAVASPDFDKRAQTIHGTPADPGVGDKLRALADEAERALQNHKAKLYTTGYNVPGYKGDAAAPGGKPRIDLGGGFSVDPQ